MIIEYCEGCNLRIDGNCYIDMRNSLKYCLKCGAGNNALVPFEDQPHIDPVKSSGLVRVSVADERRVGSSARLKKISATYSATDSSHAVARKIRSDHHAHAEPVNKTVLSPLTLSILALMSAGVLIGTANLFSSRGQDETNSGAKSSSVAEPRNQETKETLRQADLPGKASNQKENLPGPSKDASKKQDSIAEQERQAMIVSLVLQEQKAAAALEEHKKWFLQNSDKPKEFKQRISSLPATSPGSPTALEAKRLLETLKTIVGRYVRIERTGNDLHLCLAEVEVIGSNGASLAIGKKAQQSQTMFYADASRAVDGLIIDGYYLANTVTWTAGNNPWWEVDLGDEMAIESITLWSRKKGKDDLNNFTIQVLKKDRTPSWSIRVSQRPEPCVTLKVE